jgi:cyclopropane fatty-acyl-phospholipid synthase-like methyltransferase
MKSMKLYDQVHRIYDDLAAAGVGPLDPLVVDQLTPFDQYHYFGTSAVDAAIRSLHLQPGMRVLDIGSGLGGPARYIADRCGARVVAVDLQPDLHEVANDLTSRCGLTGLVEHRCADILGGWDEEPFDAVVSFLCFLHIPNKARLFEVCRGALRAGGGLYIEDYGRQRRPTDDEANALRLKVQCVDLPTPAEYVAELYRAGFEDVDLHDVTEDWQSFTASRLDLFRGTRDRNVSVYGGDVVDGLDDFYATVAGLFEGGLLAGLQITAR